jgi:hypothetical protein
MGDWARAWHIAILAWLSICLESAKLFGEREAGPAGSTCWLPPPRMPLLSMDETTDDQTEWQTTKPGISIHPRTPSLTSPSRI